MPLAFDDFVFDEEQQELLKANAPVKVDAKLLKLLAFFLRHSGELVTKEEILNRVWEGRALADNVLSVSVAKLRKVLGQRDGEREYILTIFGRGYRFVPAVSRVESKAVQTASISDLSPSAVGSAPLVGRASVMQRLDSALTRARAGRGCISVLVGEPGIGKTRVAEAFGEIATSSGALVAWAHCHKVEGAPPLWLWTQILREYLKAELSDEVEKVLKERIVESASFAREVNLSTEWAPDSAAASHRAFDEVSQLLKNLSARRPLVLVLDDLHSADAASSRLLGYLGDEIAQSPLLVVATLRSTELFPQDSRNKHLHYVIGHRNCERIELGRLSEADVAEYVIALFGEADAALSHAVYKKSEGNPFFMVELFRPWVGSKRPEPGELALSGLALDLVRQRFSNFTTETRTALAAGAVIGRNFDIGLLGHVVERNSDTLFNALEEALVNDTIVASPENPGKFAFGHDLIRDVLYEDLTAAERGRWHLRVGEGLERRRANGGEVSSAELAHHFLSALPYGEADRAVAYARRAAIAAARFYAYSDAYALLNRAVAALQFAVNLDSRLRCTLLLELSFVERALGDSRHFDHLLQAIAIAREHKHGKLLAMTGRYLSPGVSGVLGLPDACRVLEAAAEILAEEDKRERAIVLAHLAWTPPHCMGATRVKELLERADAVARESNSVSAITTVLRAKLFFSSGPATQETALAIADEIERLFDSRSELSYPWWSAEIQGSRLTLALQRGDAQAAQRAIDDYGITVQRLKHAELQWHHQRMGVIKRMNQGQFVGISSSLAELRDRARKIRLQAWPFICGFDQSVLLRQTTGLPPLSSEFEYHLKIDDSDCQNVRAVKMRTMAEFGLRNEAESALRQFTVEFLHELPIDREYLSTLANMAVTSCATRSVTHAEALYRLLKPYSRYYAADISFHCWGSVAFFLGRLARILGRELETIAHFEEALERNEHFSLAAQAAITRYELARALADQKTQTARRRARSLLAQASDAALTLGMQPLLRDAQQFLADL
jgi:DNA-binding winged helix-turn-helix (wHTH) protein